MEAQSSQGQATFSFATQESRQDIQRRFEYHAPPHQGIAKLHELLRGACGNVAHLFDSQLPSSREKSLAITKLEEAMVWANACVARSHASFEHTKPKE